jgi:hypothetical protein
MERSPIKRIGLSGTIRALSAHFEAFAFTRHEHDNFVIGVIGAGLQTFEWRSETAECRRNSGRCCEIRSLLGLKGCSGVVTGRGFTGVVAPEIQK